MLQQLKDKTLFRTTCLIDGEWVPSENGDSIEVTDPFSTKVLAKIPSLGKAKVSEAIDAADHAFNRWRRMEVKDRVQLLREWYDLIMANSDDLATIMVAEQGKPFTEAKGEVRYAASYVEFFAEEAKRIYGDILPSPFPNSRIVVLKQPVGVVGIITPWNFPIAMMVRKIAPALACGCTCVIKPDEKTPLSAFAVLELAQRAGIPAGVLNAVVGVPSEIGEEFTQNGKIKKISFTGSTRVGKILLKESASTVKKITMELGGNAPFIVFEDANIKMAVDGLITAKFRNSGQTCVCPNRIFLHNDIKADFIQKLVVEMSKLKLGSGFEAVDLGPLINQAAVERMEYLIEDALAKGGRINAGGKRHGLGGTFFEPTVVTEINSSMAIFKEEIFGPIVPIVAFQSVDEVITLANNTKHGLASYFYTKNMSKIWRVAEALEYGMVGVNRGGISSAWIPFGGIKESGMGREGSKYGVENYLNVKYVCMSD